MDKLQFLVLIYYIFIFIHQAATGTLIEHTVTSAVAHMPLNNKKKNVAGYIYTAAFAIDAG